MRFLFFILLIATLTVNAENSGSVSSQTTDCAAVCYFSDNGLPFFFEAEISPTLLVWFGQGQGFKQKQPGRSFFFFILSGNHASLQLNLPGKLGSNQPSSLNLFLIHSVATPLLEVFRL